MHARDLVEQVPLVSRATTGAEAARVVAEYRLPALVVADDAGEPLAVVHVSQILGLALPEWVREDRQLVRAYDDSAAEEIAQRLGSTTLGELLDDERLTDTEPPAVRMRDTLLQVASVMDESRAPMLVVRDDDGRYTGVVLMSRVLAAVAATAGQRSDLIDRRLATDVGSDGTGEPDRPTGGPR